MTRHARSRMKQLTSATIACVMATLVYGSPADGLPTTLPPAPLDSAAHPPGGLQAADAPQFVAVTFDDNFDQEGMSWATELFRELRNPVGAGIAGSFDGSPARTTFFVTSGYAGDMRDSWLMALRDGHEIANHTDSHGDGLEFTLERWNREIATCNSKAREAFSSPMHSFRVRGFRAPYLHYNDRLFDALLRNALVYDTSIMGCWADTADGKSCSWPYTMDHGSPDADAIYAKWRSRQVASVDAHPGLLEIPVSVAFVPDDSLAAQYGFPPGLRQRVQDQLAHASNPNFFEQATGKLVGMDITMFMDAKMTKEEALATMKHTLDLRLAGNRAPLVFIAHPHVYASRWDVHAPGIPSAVDRRGVIEEFVRYALAKPEVRMRPLAEVAAWLKDPVGLALAPPRPAGR